MSNIPNVKNNDPEKTPWLSVVIPIYNAEKLLPHCLNSIKKQTFDNYEVIMTDDESDDRTPQICKEFASKDSRFKYFRKKNGGSYQSRLFGAAKASGEYITFCDADDYYSDQHVFETLYDALKDGRYSALQFNYNKKYNHIVLKKNLTERPAEADRDLFLREEYPKLLCSSWEKAHLSTNLCNKVYHRELLAKLPEYETAERIFWGDDLIMNLYLLSDCREIRFIPNTLYCYRQASGNTGKFSARTMTDLDNIKKYQLLFLEDYDGELKDEIRNRLFSESASWLLIFLREAAGHYSDQELTELINETLKLPSFVQARDYYLNERPQENWEAVALLKAGDAEAYIKSARSYKSRKSLKDKMVDIMKKI